MKSASDRPRSPRPTLFVVLAVVLAAALTFALTPRRGEAPSGEPAADRPTAVAPAATPRGTGTVTIVEGESADGTYVNFEEPAPATAGTSPASATPTPPAT